MEGGEEENEKEKKTTPSEILGFGVLGERAEKGGWAGFPYFSRGKKKIRVCILGNESWIFSLESLKNIIGNQDDDTPPFLHASLNGWMDNRNNKCLRFSHNEDCGRGEKNHILLSRRLR